MPSRIATLLVLVAVALTGPGCAYRRAIDQGHALAQAQDYRGALAAYRRALAIDPDDEAARRHIEQITPYAIRQSEADMQRALAREAYEEAARHAHEVRELERERGEKLLDAIRDTMSVRLELQLARREMEAGYRLALRTRRLFPHAPAIGPALTRLRRHFFDASERLAQEGRYDEALQQLDVVARHEPELARDIEPRRRRIRVAWADATVARAEEHGRKGQPGAAAALYARAYELAGRERDLESMRALARELRRQGEFIVALETDVEADGGEVRLRTDALLPLAREELAAVPAVVLLDEGNEVSLVAALRVQPASCSQSTTAREGQQPYVAGMRQVPNPEHARVSAERDEHERNAARLQGDVTTRTLRVGGLRAQLASCEQNLATLITARDGAQREADAASGAVDAHKQRVAELEARLREQHSDEERRVLREQLDAARRDLREAEQRLARARQALSQAKSSHELAATRCASDRSALESAEQELAQSQGALATEQALARSAAKRLQETPTTVSEPVMEVFRYEIRDVRRTCTSSARARLESAWTSEERLALRGQHATEDATNEAHPEYGVAADPLRLPLGDDDLIAAADRAVARSLAEAVRERAQRYYRNMAERALDAQREDAHGASDMMVALLVAAAPYLTHDSRAAFERHLRQHYGLEAAALLAR